MEQFEFFEIPNPCIGVCENGPGGFCKGCFRKREERQHWNSLEDPVKRQIIRACAVRKRRAALKKLDTGEDIETQQQDLF